jgi:hypothetical protein
MKAERRKRVPPCRGDGLFVLCREGLRRRIFLIGPVISLLADGKR